MQCKQWAGLALSADICNDGLRSGIIFNIIPSPFHLEPSPDINRNIFQYLQTSEKIVALKSLILMRE